MHSNNITCQDFVADDLLQDGDYDPGFDSPTWLERLEEDKPIWN